MIELPPEYFDERYQMITELEKIAQKSPKCSAAINAEVKQLKKQLEEFENEGGSEGQDASE